MNKISVYKTGMNDPYENSNNLKYGPIHHFILSGNKLLFRIVKTNRGGMFFGFQLYIKKNILI